MTLGTIRPYRFDRMIDAVLEALNAYGRPVDVTWQVGTTTRTDLPGRIVDQLSDPEFAAEVEMADVVFAHAGVGVAMNILDRGRTPVLMARRPELQEHVDAHQREIVAYLAGRGLAWELGSGQTHPGGPIAWAASRRVRPQAVGNEALPVPDLRPTASAGDRASGADAVASGLGLPRTFGTSEPPDVASAPV